MSIIVKLKRFWHNPLAIRLSKRSGCLASKTAVIAAALLGPGVTYFIIQEATRDYYRIVPFYMYLSIMVVFLGGIISLPIFITYVAASLTVRYTRSLEYPAVCVTAMSSREIVRGYVLATLRHCSAPIILVIGMTPAFAMRLTGFLNWWSYYPPANYNSILLHTDIGPFGIVLKWALVTLLCALGLAGINFLGLTLGVGLGLWWRHATPAAVGAWIGTAGITLSAAYNVHKTVEVLHIIRMFPRHSFKYTLFLPIPYLTAWLVMRVSSRWARKG